MRKLLYPLIVIGAIACSPQKSNKMITNNPLLMEFSTPYGAPPFEQIKAEYYKPAYLEAIKLHEKEINTIVENSEEPTFQNTIETFATSGEKLTSIESIFSNLNSAETSDTLQAIAKDVAPLISAHYDNINLNAKLFARIKKVYNQKEQLNLTQEQQKLVERIYKGFERGGANLPQAKQERLRQINEQLSLLNLNFGENVLAETNDYQLIIDDIIDLSGLPEAIINAAKTAAEEAQLKDKWLFTIHKPSMIPFITYADNRELRKQILSAYAMKGDNNNDFDNKKSINQIIRLRVEKAKLFGFDNFAEYALDDRMAKHPDNVYELLGKVWEPALEVAKNEAKELENLMHLEGVKGDLQPWDWWYYAEKLRNKKYAISEDELREYFVLENVLQGAYAVANKLYGITFEPLADMPIYHPEVDVYLVKEANGKELGVFYTDFHPRAGKRGGAWMTSYRKQSGLGDERILPIISIVCNFSTASDNKPALLSYEEVNTLFHEFGHALHGLLSDCQYEYLSGTAVLSDYVELPSQIMENWAAEPEVLKMYAKHYETGATIPNALIAKLEKSKYFNQGFATVEYMSAAYLDFAFHTLTDTATLDVNAFEKQALNNIGLIPEIIVRYRSGYFNHIFTNNSYSAGYYNYMWAEVLDADAFAAFKEKGLFDKTTALAFRENILEKGGTEDPMALYLKFRGQKPEVTPLLKRRGLK